MQTAVNIAVGLAAIYALVSALRALWPGLKRSLCH